MLYIRSKGGKHYVTHAGRRYTFDTIGAAVRYAWVIYHGGTGL